MRVVGIAIVTALLSLFSAGCAIQAGEPTPEETQRPNELVGIGGGDPQGIIARPASQTKAAIGPSGPAAASPNPSPWNDQGTGDPQAGGQNGGTGGNGGSGSGNTDQPNPSPWNNGADPHVGSLGTTGGKGGTGG